MTLAPAMRNTPPTMNRTAKTIVTPAAPASGWRIRRYPVTPRIIPFNKYRKNPYPVNARNAFAFLPSVRVYAVTIKIGRERRVCRNNEIGNRPDFVNHVVCLRFLPVKRYAAHLPWVGVRFLRFANIHVDFVVVSPDVQMNPRTLRRLSAVPPWPHAECQSDARMSSSMFRRA